MQANTGNKLHKYTLGLQDVLKVQILIESVFRTGSFSTQQGRDVDVVKKLSVLENYKSGLDITISFQYAFRTKPGVLMSLYHT